MATKNLYIYIDEQDHKDFKQLCLNENVSMSKRITKLIKADIKKNG